MTMIEVEVRSCLSRSAGDLAGLHTKAKLNADF